MIKTRLALTPLPGFRPVAAAPLRMLFLIAAAAAVVPLSLTARGIYERAADRLQYPFPALSAAADPAGRAPASAPAVAAEPEQLAVAAYISKRYRVSQSMTRSFVLAAHDAARQVGLDPLLVLAVIAVESGYNPIAESVQGAKGLMQVIPRYHPDKFPAHEDDAAVLDPATNILAGARVIKEYLARSGDLTAALQMYAGAADDPVAEYAGKVLVERRRLQQVVRRAERELPGV